MVFRKKKKDPFREIQACLQKRDYKSALDWFNTLLSKDAKNTQIRLRFADTLVLAGSKKEAVKQYGVVAGELAEKGFTIRAIAIHKKILQLDPTHTELNQTLAASSQERSPAPSPAGTTSATTTSLADVLRPPDAPIVRSKPAASLEEPPAPAPAPAPASPDEPPALPELSLEESMAMEFGSTGEIPTGHPPAAAEVADATAAADPPEILGAEAEEPSPPTVREEDAIALPAPAEPDVAPSFTEESIDLGGSTDEASEEAVVEILAVEPGDAEPSMEPEIVLDVAAPARVEGDTDGGGERELELVELDVETEPAFAAGGEQSLVGALGEDIDALIDSIIDDVGSSAEAGAAEPDEPAATHIPLFSDLTSDEFLDVANLLVRRVVKAGNVVFRAGDPGDSMFIVSTGEVEASVDRDGERIVVATLRDGDFFGEMAILSGEARTATVSAVKNTELLELAQKHLQDICSRHPHVEAKIRLAYDERMDRAGL